MDTEHGKNYAVSKAGVELNFNLDKEKAWGVRISPAVVWGPVECGRLDARTGEFEITAGITYHFKGSNGKRYFTKARLYDYDEVRHPHLQEAESAGDCEPQHLDGGWHGNVRSLQGDCRGQGAFRLRGRP